METRQPNDKQARIPKSPPFYKKIITAVWLKWESLFHFLFHVKPVYPDEHGYSFIHLRKIKYNGPAIQLSEGGTLAKGDWIAEMHLDNHLLFEMSRKSDSSVHLAIQLVRNMGNMMPRIAGLLLRDPAYRDIQGIYGISMINRGVKQFGFTVSDLPPGLFAIMTRHYLRLLLWVLHPDGGSRLQTRKEMLVPKSLAISAAEIIKRYGTKEQEGRSD